MVLKQELIRIVQNHNIKTCIAEKDKLVNILYDKSLIQAIVTTHTFSEIRKIVRDHNIPTFNRSNK